MKSNKLVFFGTGKVSQAALEALANNFEIEAVITKPDVRVHNHTHPLPVKIWADTHKVPCFQPVNKNELAQLVANHNFQSSCGVVVDYGVLIPAEVIATFPKGIVNCHYSLLPQWRGADPVRAAILSGQPTTGVSLMLIDTGLDTGPLLATSKVKIDKNENVTSLYQKLIAAGNKLLLETLPAYLDGKVQFQPQPGSASYAPKLSKEAGAIDWTKPAEVIDREIRAYLGWPGSFTTLAGKEVTITKAHIGRQSGQAGQIFNEGGSLGVYCGTEALMIDRIKPANKAEMTGADFIRGYVH